jgi:PAS domain S-box-containing protein
MDWQSIAQLLAERSDRAIVVLDRANKVSLFNSAAEKMLGWRRHDVDGGSWVERFARPGQQEAAHHWLEQAQRGVLQHHECEVITKTGSSLLVALEMSLVGRGPLQSLMLWVRASLPVASSLAVHPGDGAAYEISSTPETFGEILAVSSGAPSDGVEGSRRCYEVLYARIAPCEDCPVLQRPEQPWPRVAIRIRQEQGELYELTTAEIVSSTSVRIRVRRLSTTTLEGIRQARIKALAAAAKLTDREQAVMALLIEGRSLDEIAATLSMSPRTAKFHQRNLLEKLGADSRADLFRLISL